MTQIQKIPELLHQALGSFNRFESCALLDYPNYLNIGDHLIWIGAILYLKNIANIDIKYTASIHDFSEKLMETSIGDSPIIFTGGGNLGDIWPAYQKFRERIICRYKDREIIILPQSIYFDSKENLRKTANIFNSHPKLTLFTRDDYSYSIALEAFKNCQILKAPDMAFQIGSIPRLCLNNYSKNTVLYHCREDAEFNSNFSPDAIKVPNLVVEDWISFNWVLGSPKSEWMQSIAQLIREVWQRGLKTPNEWISRQLWQHSHPYIAQFNSVYNSKLHRRSWDFIYSGIYQFSQYRVIITNRLHGHILCTILGIPHVLLPNSYYKNESFYETWTSALPFCRFVKEPAQVNSAVQEVLELFPQNQ